jgi:FkbM family methyltransferase
MRIHPQKRGMGAPGLIYLFRDHFESLIPFCIEAFVKPGSACLDIGANVGVWSLLMAERCTDTGRVYSFEPLSQNVQRFRQNVELSRKENITLTPVALGRELGEVKIYTPDDPGRTSLAPESATDRVEQVALKRLDDVWSELGCPKVDFVKIDVEGSEPMVVEGGRNFFRKCQPIIVCEVNTPKLANLGKTPADTFRLFGDLDYEAFELNEELAKLERVPEPKSGDIVFISRQSPVSQSASCFTA